VAEAQDGQNRQNQVTLSGQSKQPSAARSEEVSGYREPVRPTPEQIGRGHYRLPEGQGKQDAPALNMRPDCIAALMIAPAHLDAVQHDAARDWQELRASVLAELGVNQGRSCLDIGPSGYDAGPGNVALADFWRRVRLTLGPARMATLDRTCIEGAWPKDMGALKAALDAFAIVQGRA